MSAEQNDRSGLSRLPGDSVEIEKYYDEWAGDYDRTLVEWRYEAPRRAAEILAAHLDRDGVILDAGCGTGLTGKALADADFAVFDGIDLSSRSIDAAARHGVYRRLKQVNMQELPLPFDDDSYDGLECIGVLTYLPDSQEIFGEFCRIVRPGGVVVMTQRNDLYQERDFDRVLEAVEGMGLWRILEITDPEPYLPENAEFADRIMVHYITCRVT
jgi:predicted TPR repeat methyltransferase